MTVTLLVELMESVPYSNHEQVFLYRHLIYHKEVDPVGMEDL